ncbi:MAG: DNA-deoxyinosine glycosylase [Candidatus Nanoarchaeia archaeon]
MRGFPPIINKSTEILILGSFPSIKSLDNIMYYGHPQNHFWKILGAIINEPLYDLPYKERCKLLLKNKIGIWDVYTTCEREGSLDSNIRKPVLNNFNTLKGSKINKIIFNGKTAFKHAKHVPLDVPKHYVPSTSPANTTSIKEKTKLWKEYF